MKAVTEYAECRVYSLSTTVSSTMRYPPTTVTNARKARLRRVCPDQGPWSMRVSRSWDALPRPAIAQGYSVFQLNADRSYVDGESRKKKGISISLGRHDSVPEPRGLSRMALRYCPKVSTCSTIAEMVAEASHDRVTRLLHGAWSGPSWSWLCAPLSWAPAGTSWWTIPWWQSHPRVS
jgi:hypothetical protein